MKRYGNIFDSIISIENLREAHRNASRGKKSYRQVRKINKKTDFYLYKIQNMLKKIFLKFFTRGYFTKKFALFIKNCV